MNIHQVFFFCFLSDLWAGNCGVNIFTGSNGGKGTVTCDLPLTGSTKFFCKGECKGPNILIKTKGDTANNGKYSIDYDDGVSGRGSVTVGITDLTKSDEGTYRCGLGESSYSYYADFEIRVSYDILDLNGLFYTYIEGDNITYSCNVAANTRTSFLCKEPCSTVENVLIYSYFIKFEVGRYSIRNTLASPYGLDIKITQVTTSDSGWYRCGFGDAPFPISYERFPILVVNISGAATSSTLSTSTQSPGYFLPLVLIISSVVVLLPVVLI